MADSCQAEFDELVVHGWLDTLLSGAGGQPSLDAFHLAVQTNTIRDLEFDDSFYQQVFRLLIMAIQPMSGFTPDSVHKVYAIALGCLSAPEFAAGHNSCLDAEVVPSAVEMLLLRMKTSSEGATKAQERASDTLGGVTLVSTSAADAVQPASGKLSDLRTSGEHLVPVDSVTVSMFKKPVDKRRTETIFDEIAHLRALLYWLYIHYPARRSMITEKLVAFLNNYVLDPTKEASTAVRAALQLGVAMLRSARTPDDGTSRADTWLGVLLQLHHVPGMLTETAAVLSAFHEPLVQALVALLEGAAAAEAPAAATGGAPAAPSAAALLAAIVDGVCKAWPPLGAGNSAKAVLLLHELDQLLAWSSADSGIAGSTGSSSAAANAPAGASAAIGVVLPAVLPYIAESLASDNSRQAQMALAMFKQPRLAAAVCASPSALVAVLRALVRNGQPHWNATVNRQTHAVLVKLAETAPAPVAAAADQLWGSGQEAPDIDMLADGTPAAAAASQHAAAPAQSGIAELTGRRDAEGFLVPAPRAPKAPRVDHPSEAGASAAASKPPASVPSSGAERGVGVGGSGRREPPLGITGVAPWAAQLAPAARDHRGNPPSTITGVAPWAMPVSAPTATHGRANPPVTITGIAPWATRALAPATDSRGTPPLTITGVAPWAQPGAAASTHSAEHNTRVGATQPQPPTAAATGDVASAADRTATADASVAVPASSSASHAPSLPAALSGDSPGVRRLRGYLERLTPPPQPATMFGGVGTDEPPPDVLARVPTLLPSLAFHDLVFGRELGAGTFSVVRHAKRILRGRPGSAWPEYAVKVVSTRVMAELGYEASVRREVAVLATLTHPNVARLVSAFRWRDGAYLVSEYAPRGDLHTALTGLGSLDEAGARFLLGEAAAALAHVHAKGFAFGDCKPENILLVEDAHGGVHAKLTDFGACRPLTDEARQLVAASVDIIKNLRDGDWRAAAGITSKQQEASADPGSSSSSEGSGSAGEGLSASAAGDTDGAVASSDEGASGVDERVEGTEEYLSPELAARTSGPTIVSDAYALGVTLYQCLTGSLPDATLIWPPSSPLPAAPDQGAGSRRVRFGGGGGGVQPAFPPDFPPGAADLVRGLLHPDPAQRLGGGPRGLAEVMEHPWLAALGSPADFDQLHRRTGPTLAQGLAEPQADPTWSRRHNSTIWAPLPKTYNTLQPASAGAAAGAGPRARKSAPEFTLRELVRMDVLPPLSEPRDTVTADSNV